MLRMAVDRASFAPPTGEPSPASRLGGADLAPLSALYDTYPDGVFTADQLAHGVFYGVREGGAIVAAGGTHVVAAEYGLAAVGNVFVAPAARGHGLGGAITAAIVGELLAGPCREVILNVATDNAAAQKIYRRLGFVPHCPYSESSAVLRQPGVSPRDNTP
jgi:ribosomal protein S18 acetylase RimI-like enzyme